MKMEKVITSQTWYQECEEFPELLESYTQSTEEDPVRTGFAPKCENGTWCTIYFSDTTRDQDYDYQIFFHFDPHVFVTRRVYFVNLESKTIYLATEDWDHGGMMVKKLDQIISPRAEERLNRFLINLGREPCSTRSKERNCPYCRSILDKRDDGDGFYSWLFCDKCYFSSRLTKEDPFDEFDEMIRQIKGRG
jgi:hypothetical protein